jgi:pimeloyl-ACP methyl ester carboxylesterase
MMTFGIIALILLIACGIWFYWVWLHKNHKEQPHADETHRIRTEDGWRITLYRYLSKTDSNEPIFFSHGISGSQFCFSYPKHQSIVDSFTEAGYDCWVIDLRGNRSSEPPPGTSRFDSDFDDFLYKDIPAALDYIEKTTGHHRFHWVGHSMGGMLLYAYASVFGGERILSGTAIGTPPGFHDVNVIRFEFLQSLIKLWPGLAERIMLAGVLPIQQMRFTNSLLPINWDNMHPGVNRFNVLELPSMRLAGQLTQWVTSNSWTVNDDSVDVIAELPHMEIPLLVLAAPLDTLATTKNQNTFFENLKHGDKRILFLSKENGYAEDYNHVDLIFSKNGVEEVHRPMIQWVQEHALSSASAAPAHLQVLLKTHDALVELETPAQAASEEAPELEITITAVKQNDVEPKTEQWTSALSSAADIFKDFDRNEPQSATARPKKAVRKKPVLKKASPKSIKTKAKVKKKTSLAKIKVKNKGAAKKKTAKTKEKPKLKAAAKKTSIKKKPAAKPKAKPAIKKKATAKKQTKLKKKSSTVKTSPTKKKKATKKKKVTVKKSVKKNSTLVKKKTEAIKKPAKKKAVAVKKKSATKKKKTAVKKKTTAKKKKATRTGKKK